MCIVLLFITRKPEGRMPYDLAIVSYPRNRSFLCTTLRSVVASATPATVTIFHGHRASVPPPVKHRSAAELLLPNERHAPRCWPLPSGVTIREVTMAPDFGVLDAYFAVAAAAADGTLVPWIQPRRRGFMIIEDDILFERDFEHSFQV